MIIHGDVAFMILNAVLVLLMTPGLAFFYGGLVERKNSLTMMFQSFVAIGIVPILWIFGGYSLVFGNDFYGIIGNPLQYFGMRDLPRLIARPYDSTIPFLLFFMYQMMFAIITAPLMTGAFANRLTPGGWIKILILWMILIYFPVARWVWGDGFLARMGFVDYAGGAVIHITAGFGCLSGVFFLGPRSHKETSLPFHLGFVALGTAFLLVGWFGFNTGGALTAAGTAAIVFANTGLAAASGMVVWLLLHYLYHKRLSFLEIPVGLVAGLATITPCSGYITPLSAILVGIIGAIVCYYCVLFERKKWDDTLDVWGVHGVGGFIGTLLIGIFANPIINDVEASITQFLVQVFGSLLIAAYSIIVTYFIFYIVNRIRCIKVSDEVQEKGLDAYFFKENFTDIQLKNQK